MSSSSSASMSFNESAVDLLQALTRDDARVEFVAGDPVGPLLVGSEFSDTSVFSLDQPPSGKLPGLFCISLHIPNPLPAIRRGLSAPTVAARNSPLLLNRDSSLNLHEQALLIPH